MLALGATLISGANAQTRIDLRTQTKSVDFSSAGSTKPSKTGTTMPGSCSTGETFIKTDAAAEVPRTSCQLIERTDSSLLYQPMFRHYPLSCRKRKLCEGQENWREPRLRCKS
jgi:hypothetical protein